MTNLAAKAGGEPPLTESPKTTLLDPIRGLAGNEMLAAILKEHDELKERIGAWKGQAKLAEKRVPEWKTLSLLLEHARSIPEAAELQTEADAVRAERLLLEESDPLPPIRDKVVKLLRAALKKAHSDTKETFDREMRSLEKDKNWQALKKAERERLLGEAGIFPIGELSIGDDASLIAALSERALPVWAALADALPERFRNVTLAAAKYFEPKTQSIKLKSGTLKTAADVKTWLELTEKDLLEKVKKGPIVIS
jgi:hypothetical protein